MPVKAALQAPMTYYLDRKAILQRTFPQHVRFYSRESNQTAVLRMKDVTIQEETKAMTPVKSFVDDVNK